MLPLSELKKDLEFNEEISEIVDILKNIAISYFHHLKQKERFEEFVVGLGNFLATIDWSQAEHRFLREARNGKRGTGEKSVRSETSDNSSKSVRSETSDKELVVVITSDEPFVGGLNIRVINEALDIAGSGERVTDNGERVTDNGEREAGNGESRIPYPVSRIPQTELVVVGEQGKNYLEEADKSFTYFRGVDEELEYQQIKEVKDYLLSEYLKENLERIIVVYPRFISFAHQEVEVFQLLPYKRVTGNGERVTGNGEREIPYPVSRIPYPEVLIEPSLNRVVDYLIRLWAGEKLYEIFYESKLSELAARAMHLEGSFLELSRIRKDLKLQYIRSLHEAMDKANRDIFASRTLWNG